MPDRNAKRIQRDLVAGLRPEARRLRRGDRGVALLAAAGAARGPEGEPVYESQEGAGYEVYEDGTIIGGDVQGSRDMVLQEVQQTGAKPPREIYRQVEACEEAGFSVPGSESLPETGGPSLPVVAAPGLILSCASCRLVTR